MTKRDKVNIALIALIIVGVVGFIILILNKKQTASTSNSSQPSRQASGSAATSKTLDETLLKSLQQLDSLSGKSCPIPKGKYHTEHFVYARQNIQNHKVVYLIRFAGSPQELSTSMSPLVTQKMANLAENTPFTAYYYSIDPNASANTVSDNTTIWCFTTP